MKMKLFLLLEKARRLKRVCEWECNLDQEVECVIVIVTVCDCVCECGVLHGGEETCAGLALLALVVRWTSSWRY